MNKEYIVLLRGVTPKGKNSIPKMSYLVKLLEEAGYKQVRTYVQSGNILLETNQSIQELNNNIHTIIYQNIGADLKMVIKTKEDLRHIVENQPFPNNYDYSRIHIILYQEKIEYLMIDRLLPDYGEEEIVVGKDCIYLYLPRDAKKKKLNTNYLEHLFEVDLTMRKLNVINQLINK